MQLVGYRFLSQGDYAICCTKTNVENNDHPQGSSSLVEAERDLAEKFATRNKRGIAELVLQKEESEGSSSHLQYLTLEERGSGSQEIKRMQSMRCGGTYQSPGTLFQKRSTLLYRH